MRFFGQVRGSADFINYKNNMLTYIEMLISGELIVLCKLNFHKKRKKTAPHTCFHVTLAFADYERQRNRRGTGYYVSLTLREHVLQRLPCLTRCHQVTL